jgi:hypothetical protein
MLKDNLEIKEWKKIRFFFKNNYSNNYIFTIKKVFQYYFLDKEKKKFNIINYQKNGKIIGILGYFKSNFIWDKNNSFTKGVWTANWMVDRIFRNGVGVILMRRLQELNKIVMGQGAGDANVKIVVKMENEYYDYINRVVFYNNLKEIRYFDRKISKVCDYKLSNINSEIVYASEKEILENFKPNWKIYKYYRYCTVRSPEYIIQRYLKHPFFDYKILMIGKNQQTSLLIFRIEKISNKKKAIRILELIVPGTEQGKKNAYILINEIKKIFLEKKYTFIDFFCSNSIINKLFLKNKFLSAKNLKIPIKLRPVQRKIVHQNLEVFYKDLTKFKFANSYITKSDGDQDRINIL